MPDIHINRSGQSFGPYPEEVARQHLEAGSLLPTDLAWHEGADGWKPLSEVLAPAAPPAAEEPPPPPPPDGDAAADAPPPPADGNASNAPPPPDGDGDAAPPPPDGGGDKDTIHVTRRGDAIGPYPRAMASEYFTGGSLQPTDWGWHEGMDEWKPLYEVLNLPVPEQPAFNPAMMPQRKPGKGKKIALIAGVSVLVIGLIVAAVMFLPKFKFLGGGKIETADDLAKAAVEALKDEDKDAFADLTILKFSKGEMKDMAMAALDDLKEEDFEPLAKMKGQTASEMIEELKNEFDKNFEDRWEDLDEKRKEMRLELDSKIDDIRIAAKDSGLDWSDVTVTSVDDSKMKGGRIFGFGKSGGDEAKNKIGTLEVTVTSKGKEFRILLSAEYSTKGGWFINNLPRWAGPK